MTAEPRDVEDLVPRDVEEIATLVRRVQSLPNAAAELVAREFVAARLAAADRENAELRGEVTKVVAGLRSMQFSKYRNEPDWAWMNAGGLANRLDAALSAAPQPEPMPMSGCACGHTCDHGPHDQELDHDPEWTQAKADLGRSLAETFAEHTRAREQVPPASDEPARCEHGFTAWHWVEATARYAEWRCPGPAASGGQS